MRMCSKIYQFNYDFEQQNGHFLVLKSGESEKMTSNDLANIQVNMLNSNDIEKILPVEIEEINFDVRLFYRITHKRMLTHVLREKPLLIHDLYNILYQVVSGIKNSSKYMLHEQNFILRDEFIFIGESLNDIYMTYLPLNQVQQKPELKIELKDLLIRLVGYVKELTGDGVQQLMNELDKDTFHLDTFIAILNELRQKSNTTSFSNQQTKFTQQPAYGLDHTITPPVRSNAPIVQKGPSGEKVVDSKPTQPQSNPPIKKSRDHKQVPSGTSTQSKQAKNNSNEDEELTKQDKGKPNLLITIVLTAFVAIVTWKLYELNPSETVLIICIVLNILTIAGGVSYFLYKKNGGFKKKSEKVKKAKKKKARKQIVNQSSNDQASQTDIAQESVAPVAPSNQQIVDEEQYFKNLRNETTVLSADPGTVLLNEVAAGQEGPYLQINRDHGPERIVINKNHFTVGRNPNGTDYVEDTVGISRLHFEIKRTNEQYSLKDLGSKNGTKLNGEPLVPYKVYTLQDEDTIKAGKLTYSFKEK